MRTSSGKRLWKWTATLLIFPEGCILAMFPILYATIYIYIDLTFVELFWKGEYISNEGNILSSVTYAYPFSSLAPIYLFVTLARNKKLHLQTVCSLNQIALTKNFKSYLTQLWVSSLRFFAGFHDSKEETSLRYSRWGPKNQSFSETLRVFFLVCFVIWFILRLWGDL